MAERYVIVLDAGSSCPRCCLFDGSGRIAAEAAGVWLYLDEDQQSMAREFDAEAVWGEFCSLIAGCMRDAKAEPNNVAAVAATSQRQGIVFLDTQGCELYAGPNTDLRAVFEGSAIDHEMRGRVYRTTGHTPSMLFAPAKLRWFEVQQPDTYGRIATVLTLADWLVWRLCGEIASEPSLAGEAGLLDISSRRWCTDLLDELGLPGNGHVPLIRSGTVVGNVTERAAPQTGLAAGTPVATSGADTQCSLLGMGVASEHEVGVVAGWSVPLQMVTAAPVLSPSASTWAGCFVTSGRWVLESTSGDAGNSYRWLAETVFGDGNGTFEEMDRLASEVPEGSEGAMTFLGSSRMDMSKLGFKQGGLLFPVPLTFSDTGRGHLARAALEAISYAIRANLEQAEALAGHQATVVALGGGMTRTQTFSKIATDVLGRVLRLSPEPRVSAVGAYLCAATALGDFSSLEEASESAANKMKAVHPEPVTASEYDSHYQRWLETARHLDEIAP